MESKNIISRVKKVFPIEGRKDFFKYVIDENGQIAKDYKEKEMYFDDKSQAVLVCNARNKVRNKLNKNN